MTTPTDALLAYPEDGPDPIVRLVRRYTRTELPLFALGIVTSLLGRGASLVPPLVLGVTIDALFTANAPYRLPFVPATWLPPSTTGLFVLSLSLIAGAFVLGVAFGWTEGISLSLFSNRVQHRLRVDTYAAMQRLDMTFFDEKQTGQVMSVLNDDVRNLRWFLGSTVSSGLQLVATLVGIAAILFYLNWQLALVTLVAVPLLGGFTLWFMRRIRPLYRALRSSIGALNARLENNISGIEVIKTSNAEAYETDRIAEASWEYYLRTWAVSKLEYLYQPTMDLLAGAAFAATFVIGGVWILFGPPAPFSGDLFVGEFVTFLFMTQRFVEPLASVGRIVNSYENARSSAERVFSLLDRPTTVVESPEAVPLENVRGRVEFDAVSFAYRPETPVLTDLSFVVEPGEKLALVGPTGAGKSTVAKLLLRLYDVDGSNAPVRQSESQLDADDGGGGSIRIDGIDVRDATLDSLRSAIAYVGQDVFLFDGTVRENVTYGAFDATEAEMVAAARAAEAHEFIRALPDGYDTRIGERGVKLSGGQRQRLSIARAMLQNPAILVLDEATSAVDTETELLIQQGLDRLTADRTTVVVAHRLSTVRDSDIILVLDDGQVVERGTHDELLALDGLYADLWAIQAGDHAAVSVDFRARVAERGVETD